MSLCLSLLIALLLSLLLGGCRGEIENDARPSIEAATLDAAPRGDAQKGRELIERFECARCHEGAGLQPVAQSKQCFGCHRDIMSGAFASPASVEAEWRARVEPFSAAPALATAGGYYRREWLTQFLMDPKSARPRLAPSMPRLAMTADEARDIAAALAPDDDGRAALSLDGADAGRGKALCDAKGCGSCHVFTGTAPLADAPPEALRVPALTLAPDLRFARERLRPEALVAFLMNPASMKPGTLMPSYALSAAEARDIALFLLKTPLAPLAPEPPAARLPLLTREVTFEEVSQRVFRRTCWHCHGEPDYARGEGGPGNTGGFGFAARGLSLADYEGAVSGSLDDHGERRSVLTSEGGEPPRLIKALLARQEEARGRSAPGLRGMPLGMPPLSPEDVQLVESWIAQGRRE